MRVRQKAPAAPMTLMQGWNRDRKEKLRRRDFETELTRRKGRVLALTSVSEHTQ